MKDKCWNLKTHGQEGTRGYSSSKGGISQQSKEFTKCVRVLSMTVNPRGRSVKAGDAVHHWNIVAPQLTSCFSSCWTVLVYQAHSQLFVVKYTTSCTAAKCPSIWWATSLSVSASDVVPYLKAILPITPQNWTHPWHSCLQSNVPNYVSHIVTKAFDNFSKKGSPNNRELRLTFPGVTSKTAYGMLVFIFL